MGNIENILFHVEGDRDVKPEYFIELYHRIKQVDLRQGKPHAERIELKEENLRDLNSSNFAEKTELKFNIEDPFELRQFLSDLYFIRMSVRNLTLISVDNSASVACDKWDLDLNFDFNQRADVLITKKVEHTEIKCTDEMKSLVFFEEDNTIHGQRNVCRLETNQ